jgi:hypothetical protein
LLVTSAGIGSFGFDAFYFICIFMKSFSVATGCVGTGKPTWLTPDVTPLFAFLVLPTPSIDEESEIVKFHVPKMDNDVLKRVVELAQALRKDRDPMAISLGSCLSLR